MLSLIDRVSGRPWAIHGEMAAHVRGIVMREGLGGLRHLAGLKAEIHAFDGSHPETYSAIPGTINSRRPGAKPALGSIAVVPIIGTLTQRGEMIDSAMTRSTDDIAAEVQAMAAQPEVAAIVLEVDSPGGDVSKVTEAFSAIRDASKAKPVVAVANSFAASAAYWMASAADELLVTPSGQVGSIGVYSLHVDVSAQLEALGEKWTFISAGKYKIEGNPTEPLSDEARMATQATVNDFYAMFVRDVAKGRGVSVDTVRNGFGEGRMVGAKVAVEQGMATAVGTIEDAIKRAGALAKERRAGAGDTNAQRAALAGLRTL